MLDTHKILIVEDEPIVAYDLAEGLTDAGATVHVACTLEAAIAVIDEGWTIAVLDHGLGTTTADPLYAELSRRVVPFVVVTAYPPFMISVPKT